MSHSNTSWKMKKHRLLYFQKIKSLQRKKTVFLLNTLIVLMLVENLDTNAR